VGRIGDESYTVQQWQPPYRISPQECPRERADHAVFCADGTTGDPPQPASKV
jgi:hypothetical protein